MIPKLNNIMIDDETGKGYLCDRSGYSYAGTCSAMILVILSVLVQVQRLEDERDLLKSIL